MYSYYKSTPGIHKGIYLLPWWARYFMVYPFYFVIVFSILSLFHVGLLLQFGPYNFYPLSFGLAIGWIVIMEVVIRITRYYRGWNWKENLYPKPERNLKYDWEQSRFKNEEKKDVENEKSNN